MQAVETVSRKVLSTYDPTGNGPIGVGGEGEGDPDCAIELLKMVVSFSSWSACSRLHTYHYCSSSDLQSNLWPVQ